METLELILAVFPGESLAAEALDMLKASQEAGMFRLGDVAVLAKDMSGITAVKEDQDLSAGRGSLFGALVGGLIGLIGGPAGALVGAAAGAATGGWVAGKTDLGFNDAFLNELKEALQPGSSALLLLVEEVFGDKISEALEARDAKIYRHAVRKEILERLAEARD